MKKDLIINRNGYGFGYDWQMIVTKDEQTKVFYLGQDAKVCCRILGMRPDELVREIGSNNLSLKKTRVAICELILEAIGVTPENENEFFKLKEWEIAAE